MPSTIEWTDETWNPVVGCSKTSPGCDNCYAIGVAHRAMQPAHVGLTVNTAYGPDWTGEVRCLPDRLAQPSKWRKPRKVFVNSMSDLFHPAVPELFIVQVFARMALAPRHTFQILTKRSQRMAQVVGRESFAGRVYEAMDACVAYEDHPLRYPAWPLPNGWLGASIENDRYAFRAAHVRATPAAVRFLSLEPLLGPLPSLNLDGIGWVIVGGESGHGARPMVLGWVRDIRDRCQDARVPFHFKQWGAHDADGRRGNKHDNGRTLDGRTWDEWPVPSS